MRALLLLLSGLLAISGADAAEKMLDISALNLHKSQYDGQTLTIRGYLVIGPESMYIVKRLGYDKDYWANDSGCLSILNTGDLGEKGDIYNGKYVEVEGIFRASNYSYGISLSECGLTGLDIDGNANGRVKIIPKKLNSDR
jgi:hypothetical protein